MIIVILAVVGLCLGSFVNALVWRVHEQAKQGKKKKPDQAYTKRLSITTGKSMCPHCKHELAAKDLIPVFSWLNLHGKCRYCKKPIAVQYPLVEAATAVLFVVSYIWWPINLSPAGQVSIFIFWLLLLTGLIALVIYDLRWYLLPDRIIIFLSCVAIAQALTIIQVATHPLTTLLNMIGGVAIGGGIFYLLFQVSKGRWIGGGDVKLGWLLGLIAATPGRSVLFIFLAALLGSLASVPLLTSKRLSRNSLIPFGPFLIAGLFIVQLFGADILHWYQHTFINY